MRITAENIDRAEIQSFLDTWQISQSTITADQLIEKIVGAVNEEHDGCGDCLGSIPVFFGLNNRYEIELSVDDSDEDWPSIMLFPIAYGRVMDGDQLDIYRHWDDDEETDSGR